MGLVYNFIQDDCQNYIRVLAHVKDGEMLVCGTNAFNPLCRRYGRNVRVLLSFYRVTLG